MKRLLLIALTLICAVPAFAEAAIEAGVDMSVLTWPNFFLKNLLPVSLGNLVGGYLLANVGVPVYCFICGGAMLLALVIFIMGKPFAVTEQA